MFVILGIRRKPFCLRTIETVKLWKHPQPPTCTPTSPKNKKKKKELRDSARETKRKKQYGMEKFNKNKNDFD